jgi:hypothetical protein
VFSLTARVWPRGNWSYMIYRMGRTGWWVVGTKKGGGARSTARNGGGRGGASVFPARVSKHGGMERTRASWSRADVISVPSLAGGGVEGGCRRGGGSGFTGGNGGTVFLRFRPKREQSSMRVG